MACPVSRIQNPTVYAALPRVPMATKIKRFDQCFDCAKGRVNPGLLCVCVSDRGRELNNQRSANPTSRVFFILQRIFFYNKH